MDRVPRNGYLAQRPVVMGIAKILFLSLSQLSITNAAPLGISHLFRVQDEEEPKSPEDPSLWIYLAFAAALVLLGGAFAGLTIALMGQDEIYLQVIKTSGEGAEKKHAAKVLKLLNRGKHWVLVTLLLSNVITNETLPIILDRSLGGGWPAVLGSTVLIVIFGEIAPQSVCVRYGLPIGAWMAPFVLVLMWILSPVAWPTAKLLDYLLGEDHGTVYKKAGLKTLVSLHKSLGETGQQLNTDEVTIITAVLDLKDKPIGKIMTPMDDVFTLSADDVLDEDTMDDILSQGYSRIPIHHPDNELNFVGMLLVKMLITYDPEDARPVRDFSLATLPETSPETSCLDIVNFFQEGKSHMVLVSDYPGQDKGALGVVTLEDVIEELIGEEIIDESDVFVDVHKAMRRLAPAPRHRIPKGQIAMPITEYNDGAETDLVEIDENKQLKSEDLHKTHTTDGKTPAACAESPNHTSNGLTRRRSSAGGSQQGDPKNGKRKDTTELRKHLAHLGPSNVASRPKATRFNTVKIKPGISNNTDPTSATSPVPPLLATKPTPARRISESSPVYFGGIGEGLVENAGREASDGVLALHTGYGTVSGGSPTNYRPSSSSKAIQADSSDLLSGPNDSTNGRDPSRGRSTGPKDNGQASLKSERSHSTIGSLDGHSRATSHVVKAKRNIGGGVRSGSITEQIIDHNGIRKVVLEMTSSSSSAEEDNSGANKMGMSHKSSSRIRSSSEHAINGEGQHKKKKRRRKNHKGKGGETEPLLSKN